MKRTWQTILPACFSLCFAYTVNTFASTQHASFSSAEHVAIGNNINLHYTSGDAGKIGELIHLPNGLQYSYGELLTLGDFYEIVGQPISQAQSEAERRARFLAAFSSFALNPATVDEATKIMDVIHNEQKVVADGIKNGERPEDIYQKFGHENDRQFNCITGGGCDANTWWLNPGRYLDLANQDYDHFGDAAWLTYTTGHQIALEEAAAAHQNNDLKMLDMAYAMNAFASHFLTDRFSTGHMRTPREELAEKVTPGTIGSLLSSYMHAEECAYGLHVHNLRGDHWIAYGDKSYFSKKSADQRQIINETLQNSTDQIFAAYEQGTTQIADNIHDLIPIADETGNNSNLDLSPLFYWDSQTKTLMRRSVLANPFDRNWTSNWWGWSTLIELKRERGISEEIQAKLMLSPLREQAVRDGLITNEQFISYKP